MPFDIQHHAALGSTNDVAEALAVEGCRHGTVVWADQQTAGHGRHGRPWHSPPGNLLFSVVLRPAVPASRAAELGFLSAVVVADYVAGLMPGDGGVELKWPNDVLLKGAKVAGLLPAAQCTGETLAWAVLGIGLNIAHFPSGTPYPATSLNAHGVAITPEQGLHAILDRFTYWLSRWEHEGFDIVRTAWLARARGLGREVTVGHGTGQLRGVFLGLEADGAMRLDIDGAERRITAGDVAFGTAGPGATSAGQA